MNFQGFNIKTNFGCSGIAEDTEAGGMPISIIYPNGQQYSFTYETTPGNPGYFTGRLKRVTLPTGGYYEYNYTGPNDSINCTDGTVTQMTRVVNDGSTSNTWQYSRAPSGSNWVTTVTAPQLPYDTAPNQTVYTFDAQAREISQATYQGSAAGTPLRTINTTWNQSFPWVPSTPASRVTILEDGTTQSKTETTYDTWSGNLLSLKEYDWGLVPLRTTTFEYNSDTNYTSRGIVNLLSRKTIYDGGGAVQYRQDIKYDETGLSPCPTGVIQHDDTHYPCTFKYRGNPTSVTTYKTPATSADPVSKTFTYDIFGNVITASVNCCQQKTFNYSATTNYAFPDSITRGSPGTQLTTSATYNGWTGQVMTTTDENNKQTTYAYNDSLKRLTSVTRPDNAQITYSYDDTALTVTTNSPLQGTSAVTQTVTYDGLGQPILTAVSGGATTYSKVKTTYDPIGRVYQTTNPFTGASTSYVTTNKFDALNRLAAVVLPDNAQTTYSYATNTVTVTDPSFKQRKSQSDAAGRLVSVFEPDVTQPGNPLTQQTSYTYTVLNAVQTLTQGVQTRTYGYDNLGRLKSVKTPETNQLATTYEYNDFDLPITRTDPRGVITSYGYEGLNRLQTVSYNVGTTGVPATPTVTFTYGTDPAQNNNGRLLSMTDGAGSKTYKYDILGQMKQLDNVISGTTYTTLYQYNLAGELTQITYPSGRIVQQSYDAGGRLCAIAQTTTDCAPTSYYASGFAYNDAQQVTGFNYGNGIAASLTYSPDRLQLNNFNYSVLSVTTGLTYSYKQDATNCPNAPAGNNGQMQCITDSADAGRNITYTYDALRRLSTAVTQGSVNFPQWGLSWTYDRYGNRRAQTVTAGTGVPSNSVTIDPVTNRLIDAGYSYDLNGNMTNDGLNTLTYDAENRIVTAIGATYSYDGNGLRVKKVSGSTTTVYVFSGSKVIAEYDNGAVANAPSREYIYSGPQLLAKIEGGAVNYFMRDHLSVRGTTNATTDLLGQQAHYPYGETWYSQGTAAKWQFTSYEHDAESGNDYAMARYYVNRLGRFNAPDPIAGEVTNPQSLNRYGYTLNDPLNRVDPLGLASCAGQECIEMETMNMGLRGAAGRVCNLDGMRTSCGLVSNIADTGSTAICLNAGCTLTIPLEPVISGTGVFTGSLSLPGFATFAGPCPNGDCSTTPRVVEVDPVLQFFVTISTGSTGSPATREASTILDERANALAHAINNTGVQSLGNPCTVALWYGASAGGAVAVSSTEAGGALFPWTKDAIDALKVWYSLANDSVKAMVKHAAVASAFVVAKVGQGCSSIQ